ncbi:MAG TPA: hypothetical protein VNV44_13005 [Solirubrobacteraceae bacterium]|jgi:hypothetical protein|nr:hypothetical protein [Solirubrobacteraceae bacterium]
MQTAQPVPPHPPGARSRGGHGHTLEGGPEGNERLTVQAGAVLFVLLAVLGVTIIRIGQLLWLHLFLGLLLLGPLALKLASTGWRFGSYYLGRAAYRVKGPPPAGLRLLAPLLVIDTLVVFVSGVVLLFEGPSSRSSLLPVHKISFFVWLALFALHVLGHLPEMFTGLVESRQTRAAVLAAGTGAGVPLRRGPSLGSYLPARRLPGSSGRGLALTLGLLAGVLLAVVLIPEFGPWVSHGSFHHHR